MTARIVAGILLLAVLSGMLGLLVRFANEPLPAPDVAEANDLRERTEANWGDLDEDTYPADAPELTVVDLAGEVVYSQGEVIGDELQAVRERALNFSIEVAGESVGQLFVATEEERVLAEKTRSLTLWFGVALGAAVLIVLGYVLWLEWRVLRPFRKLQQFARRVAAGDLTVPLEMDRGNHFGAFTEAFDVMRTELEVARRAERETRESKRELIAQLSHDIRTPVATIGATAELLELDEREPSRAAKLRVVHDKTRQIDELLAELFDANAEQIDQLSVTAQTLSTGELAELIRAADVENRLGEVTLPRALVEVDPRRMAQVLDNVFANTAKYAATRMRLSSSLGDGHLELRLRDFGPGVAEHEHSLVLGKGVRGANAADVPGFGLGLCTAARLMERMGGSCSTRSAADGGFEVVLTVLLSG